MTQVKTIRKTYPVYSLSTYSKRRKISHVRLMETEAIVDISTQTLFLDSLNIDSRTLADARRLSRRFETIISPIHYETLYLSEHIIDPLAETHFPGYFRNIYLFTRHVETRSNLDARSTRRVLDKVQRLSSLRWRYVENQSLTGANFPFSTPSDILSLYHIKVNKTKIYVEDLPLKDSYSDIYSTYTQHIPASNLVSLKMQSPTLTRTIDSLKRFLVQAQCAQNLNYNGRGQGTRFEFNGNERLPPLKGILLQSYDWNHSADEVRRHWNFSRIEHLTLIDVPLFKFLTSVPIPQLNNLRTLHCEDFTTHTLYQREDVTRILHALIGRIEALETIKITCNTELFPIDSLLCHANSLEVLSFRDYVGFGDETQRYPTMRAEDLTQLSHALVNLNYLELGMDAAMCDPDQFLETLCNFPRLHTLNLNTQTVWRAHHAVRNYEDLDYNAAVDMLEALIRDKRGSPWRRITINVGGWKPVMVRRLGAAWREKNLQGVYAERCFHMERDEKTGEYTFREEEGKDNTCI
ncbi:hypothetical protein F5Y00DRAFT_253537 [Daldinia vernicosa]|uniref:uncharacterized protein n=1 Tax=Daldinia vernicosa TaxID=114800 RepID=UPI002008CBA3|nr:uncharacterized protein F5Y00DRAFT_253537 [Daldinia vernicosa]KAI0848172.1 hypothetical protein F5Y00DRAFT_253537 [Daldinia vernicosa]